jgi:hypothetical protein
MCLVRKIIFIEIPVIKCVRCAEAGTGEGCWELELGRDATLEAREGSWLQVDDETMGGLA